MKRFYGILLVFLFGALWIGLAWLVAGCISNPTPSNTTAEPCSIYVEENPPYPKLLWVPADRSKYAMKDLYFMATQDVIALDDYILQLERILDDVRKQTK